MKTWIVGGIAGLLSVAGLVYWRYGSEDEMTKFSKRQITPVVFDEQRYRSERDVSVQYCPAKSELVKRGNIWHTKDDEWLSHTDSTASEVTEFIGAQWVGTAHKGQVMCMYSTDEVIAFTLTLESKNATLVSEPENLPNWSALIDGRYRVCRSSNVADCAYEVERKRAKTRDEIMNEIRWQPKTTRNDG